jgi:TolB-like protein/Tfp pilus assembly protein PilF
MGLADALITRLSKVKRFVVRPTSSITSFGDGPIDPVVAGRELNVDFILNGSIKKANDRLRVTVQLLYVAENAAIWATSIDEELADVFSLEDKLASKVVDGLLPQLTADERDEFVKRGTEDPEAFEHYLRGRYYFNTFTEESFAKAFVSFHSAISADPDYAHAYAGLADYYNWLGIMGVLSPQECFRPAIEAAKRAVELDENLSEAHASFGFSLHAGNYEWSRAEHHLKRAIELNPNNSNAYVWYSIVMFTEGRFSEGLKYAERGVEIDPLAPFNHHNIAWGLYYARRYDDAAGAYRKVIADFPEYSFGYYGLSKVLRMKGDTQGAIHENARAMELLGNSIFSLLSEAECYAADGQRGVALQKLAELRKQAEERYVSPYQLALSYCFLGDTDTAIAKLKEALELKEGWLNWAGVEPVFDSLRGDPRFKKLVEDTGYRPFFSSFSSLNATALADKPQPDLHSLTTLVIDEGDITNDGTLSLKAPRSYLKYAAAALLAILVIGAVAIAISYYQRSRPAAPTAARISASSIVVLPFSGTDQSSTEIGNGLADALTNKLGNIKSLQVISANTGRSLASADPAKLDSELGIAYVLRGSIGRNGSSFTTKAELWDTRGGNVVFNEEMAAPDGNLFELQTRLAEKVWKALGVDPLPIERRQVERSYTESISAYQLYLRGRSEMTNRSVEALTAAAATFSSSIREDPNFALAYVGLADALALLNLYSVSPPANSYDEAKRNLTRALELDANLAEAHATLGYIRFFHDRDRTGSELEFRRAIQVNPSYAPAHHWFALTLAAKGEKTDAETEIAIAKRLDPRSAAIRSAAGVVHFQLGDFARAISESDAAIALEVRSIPAYKVKRWAYTAMGDRGLASAALAKEMEYSGDSEEPGWNLIKVQVESIGGNKEELLRKINECLRDPSVRNNPGGFR